MKRHAAPQGSSNPTKASLSAAKSAREQRGPAVIAVTAQRDRLKTKTGNADQISKRLRIPREQVVVGLIRPEAPVSAFGFVRNREQKLASRPKQPACFFKRRERVGHVLERMITNHDIKRAVGKKARGFGELDSGALHLGPELAGHVEPDASCTTQPG